MMSIFVFFFLRGEMLSMSNLSTFFYNFSNVIIYIRMNCLASFIIYLWYVLMITLRKMKITATAVRKVGEVRVI